MRIAIAALALTASLALGAVPSYAEQAQGYVPAQGDEVVIYTHHFKAENFEEGLKLVREGFVAAQKTAGHTRVNYFLFNRTSYDVVVISYFEPRSDVDAWHRHSARLGVLEKLAPMRRAPLELERFQLDSVRTTQ